MESRTRKTNDHVSRRAFLGLAASGVATLAACGGDETPLSTPTPVPDLSTPIARISGYEEPGRWAGRTLRVGAWGGDVQAALSERIFRPFSQATGCVVEGLGAGYDDLATSIASGAPYVDVMIGDGFWAETALTAGMASPLPDDAVQLDRFAPLLPAASAVPAYAYAMAAGFRRDSVADREPPDGWRQWSDVSAYPGARALPAQAFGSLEIALLIDGVPPAELYPLDVERALSRLAQLAPAVGERWWATSAQPALWLSRQRADFAAAWHHGLVDAQLDGRPVDFIWNEALVIADYWVIANGSQSIDVAVDFLRFATAPEIQASLSNAVPLGPVTPDAFAFVDPRLTRRLPTSPDHAGGVIRVDTAWWATNGDAARAQFDSWLDGVLPDAV